MRWEPVALVTGKSNEGGVTCPTSFSSSGLGSKRSMWLGPPSMNSQITDFARGGWCGGLAARVLRRAARAAGSAPASVRSWTRANAPSPLPDRQRNSRLDRIPRLAEDWIDWGWAITVQNLYTNSLELSSIRQ